METAHGALGGNMDNAFVRVIVLGIARDGVMAAGGWLTLHGFSQSNVQGFEGSLVFLVGFAFSVYDKFHVRGLVATAAAGASNAQGTSS
jgi:hypothetical protein